MDKQFGGTLVDAEILLTNDYSKSYKKALVIENPLSKEKECLLVYGKLLTDQKNRFRDNETIRTSLIVNISEKEIETLNTIYSVKNWKSNFYKEVINIV